MFKTSSGLSTCGLMITAVKQGSGWVGLVVRRFGEAWGPTNRLNSLLLPPNLPFVRTGGYFCILSLGVTT